MGVEGVTNHSRAAFAMETPAGASFRATQVFDTKTLVTAVQVPAICSSQASPRTGARLGVRYTQQEAARARDFHTLA